MPPHLRLGRLGEDIAVRYLEGAGLVILARNWRCGDGELDVVATDRSQLVICEIKTRSSTAYGTPTEAVDDAKADRIRRLATKWRLHYRLWHCPIRFDIVSVLWPPGGEAQVKHLIGAF
ncbi:Endonuclease [Alloactinosynnema sp. L-07]|uniref:YraN family protein n=1 Tax=Alloactinosynnema sp. L-07 TaxID=1653480 RepID=UPI00065EF88A|nr:YraN family protein [Alloactinosynnema sp. L-07]CRK58620.1 Endonuclease [Alloactinosynnema sp. L-07]